jgi:putative nucleotidyltransferase with HDIG domain
MDLDRHVAGFRAFADTHLNGEETNDYNIRLKREHSLNVLANGRAIVQSEGIAGRTGELAVLASLYHDIGRFQQFARFGTYKDADSMHHGRLGVLTLRKLSLPDDVSATEWRLIRAAVGLHNAKTVNPSINGALRTLVDVVRDADKVDIFAVILDHLSVRDNSQGVVIHSLEEHPTRYTVPVYETIVSGAPCDYGSLRYSNDFILLLLGWLFSLSFLSSLDMLSRRGLVDKAFSLLPDDARIKALEQKVHALIHYKKQSPLAQTDLKP